MRPVIGITCNYMPGEVTSRISPPITSGVQCVNSLAEDYVHAVEAGGAVPVLLPVCGNPEHAKALLGRLDGLVFSGGADVNPLLYGEFPSSHIGRVNHTQDLHELALLRYVIGETAMPVLAICRGMQLLNVVVGGTLYQDHEEGGLPTHRLEHAEKSAVTHDVEIKPGSLLSEIVGEKPVLVNSYHHQSVKEMGAGVEVTAKCGRVAEAIELPQRAGFTLGVQWHPELLFTRHAGQLALFQELARCAQGER